MIVRFSPSTISPAQTTSPDAVADDDLRAVLGADQRQP